MNYDREDTKLIAHAIRSISQGGKTGPEGLEALGIKLAGEGYQDNLADTLETVIGYHASIVADATLEGLNAIADAIRESNS